MTLDPKRPTLGLVNVACAVYDTVHFTSNKNTHDTRDARGLFFRPPPVFPETWGLFDHHIKVPTQARSASVPRRMTTNFISLSISSAERVIPCDSFRRSPPAADHPAVPVPLTNLHFQPLPRHQTRIPLTSSKIPSVAAPCHTLPSSFGPVSPAQLTLLEHNLHPRAHNGQIHTIPS